MSMFHYNESQAYFMAQMQQKQMLRELQLRQREKEQLRSLQTERASQRQFRLMYVVRHWMHRLVPGLARTML